METHNLYLAIIQNATGKPTDLWADEVFFSKIGVRNYNWVRYKDGTTLGGFGIETTPRELGKIALCVANHGIYNNQQIVPAEWITEMTAPTGGNSHMAFHLDITGGWIPPGIFTLCGDMAVNLLL